ncbi:Hypothetical protein MCYN_0721 [Mycoplasmopsis cynos C142]|uniref:Uncharacterized protein n=1 Tax=Mycoplasmopsis cynos (strain C142) TaxID=1246955 RepID=L0RUY7_MYCC1|nr:Hypothetical protein MCYN_0721 [Mycoplasmopsis cynos C142]
MFLSFKEFPNLILTILASEPSLKLHEATIKGAKSAQLNNNFLNFINVLLDFWTKLGEKRLATLELPRSATKSISQPFYKYKIVPLSMTIL